MQPNESGAICADRHSPALSRPIRYAREREFLEEKLRQLVFKSHRIVFRIDEAEGVVHVLQVRHSKRRALVVSQGQRIVVTLVLKQGSRGHVVKTDYDALTQGEQSILNLFRLGDVFWIEHPPDYRFAHTKSLGEIRIWNAALANGEIER